MNNSIIEFLINNNARISNGDSWLVVNEVGKDTFYTVYKKSYGRKKTSTLYNGIYLETALMFLKSEE